MTTLRAIETRYRGHRFRSRLEARWATFFDSLHIRYEYEPETFALGKLGAYLPDFWLPDHGVWVEIKPILPGPTERAKYDQLAQRSGYDLWLFYAPDFAPPSEPDRGAWAVWFGSDANEGDVPDYRSEAPGWAECGCCHEPVLYEELRWDQHRAANPGIHGPAEMDEALNIRGFSLLRAYEKARSARFDSPFDRFWIGELMGGERYR